MLLFPQVPVSDKLSKPSPKWQDCPHQWLDVPVYEFHELL